MQPSGSKPGQKPRSAAPWPPALAALVTLAWRAPEPPAQTEAAQARILAALAEAPPAAADAPDDAPDELRDALASIEPPAVAELFELFAEGGVPPSWPVAPEAERPSFTLGPTELRSVAAALDVHHERLRPFLDRLADEEPDVRRRERALQLLEVLGTDRDVRLLARLAVVPPELEASGSPPQDGQRPRAQGSADRAAAVPRPLRAAFRAALQSLLARQPEAAGRFFALFTSVPPALASELVTALEASGSPERLELLGSLLGRVPPLDGQLLAALGRVARDAGGPGPEGVGRNVRLMLGRTEGDLARQAAFVLGALEDFEAVPELALLLDDADPALRSAARSALQLIAARDLGERPGRWLAWHDEELAWWQHRSLDCFATLQTGDAAAAVAALNEASGRRLYRHELAAELAWGLERREREVVVLTCGVLAGLGSDAPLPALRSLAESPDPEVARAAVRTLATLGRSAAEARGRRPQNEIRAPAAPPAEGG